MPEIMRDSSGLLQFFCRHLVALCITVKDRCAGQTGNQPRFNSYSGTLLRIREATYFLTAGHILKNIYEETKNDRVEICGAVLADSFGPNPVSLQPIPFDLLNEPRSYVDDPEAGLDYGVIQLRQNYSRLLEANGLVFIDEENWRNQPDNLDGYLMLGLPQTLASKQISKSGEATVEPVIISVQKTGTSIEGRTPTRNPQFVGQIDPQLPLRSIVGMSGGPIFGVKLGPPTQYWIVALQSAWLPSSGVVVGCPLPLLASFLTNGGSIAHD